MFENFVVCTLINHYIKCYSNGKHLTWRANDGALLYQFSYERINNQSKTFDTLYYLIQRRKKNNKILFKVFEHVSFRN